MQLLNPTTYSDKSVGLWAKIVTNCRHRGFYPGDFSHMAGALSINRLMQVYSCIIWLAMSVAQRWRHCLMRATWSEQISWLPLSWDDKLSSELEYALYQLGTYTQHAYRYWRHTNSRGIPLFLIFVLIDCVCQSHVPILAVFKMIKQVKYGPTQITHNSPCGTFCWWLFSQLILPSILVCFLTVK